LLKRILTISSKTQAWIYNSGVVIADWYWDGQFPGVSQWCRVYRGHGHGTECVLSSCHRMYWLHSHCILLNTENFILFVNLLLSFIFFKVNFLTRRNYFLSYDEHMWFLCCPFKGKEIQRDCFVCLSLQLNIGYNFAIS